MGKYYLRTGPVTTRMWTGDLSRLPDYSLKPYISVNSIDTIMGCHGIAYTYYQDAPVYGLLAPSEETHDRSPVNPSTALAEPTTSQKWQPSRPQSPDRAVQPFRSCRSPAVIRLRALGERAKSSAHPSLERGNISPFTSPHFHGATPSSAP